MAGLGRNSAAWVRTTRLSSGLILFAYVLTHFLNHACGLISLSAMEAGLAVNGGFWQSPVGRPLLYCAFLAHLLLALWSLYQRPTLSMPRKEALRLGLGLSIPFLAAQHVVNTRLGNMLYGVHPTYSLELYSFFVLTPANALVQTALLLVVWWHGCLGLQFVLQLRPWYAKARTWLFAWAVMVPTLALLGFWEGGQVVRAMAGNAAWIAAMKAASRAPSPAQKAALFAVRDGVWMAMAGLLALTLLARRLRWAWGARRGVLTVRYPGGRVVKALPGMSVLDASRMGGLPHASICGGRGRCSTCRVRVDEGDCLAPPPSPDEAAVLQRVGAAPKVRLACQFRPAGDVSVTPLLPANAQAADGFARPAQFMGQEREIAILFADIRGFTQLSEHKLPYDVVFILNRYFAEMGSAVEAAGGRVDKFMGDGVMALFGLEGPPEQACRQALAASADMARRLDGLNRSLAHDLAEPLRIGIGVHCGPAIVGAMGYGQAMHLTAIGDAVNTASRLEALCKPNHCQLVVSRHAAERSGLDLGRHPLLSLDIRGRAGALEAYTVEQARDLATINETQQA
ncbi:MAG TPA: adenylate/guanylate cyclase domain-containing protein [bacterium]|jgi:adenylate cyclase|nr:adenylate/guanylate cyclase domain-containing protein [bacterium]